jgi:hypothetical protein
MIGIVGMVFFVWQMLIPLILANREQEDDDAFNSRFYAYGDSQTITINFTAIANSTNLNTNSDVARASKALSSCKYSYIDMFYNRGRISMAIDDTTPNDGSCSSAIRFSKENTIRTLDCQVPSENMTSWSGWMNPEFPSVSEIDGYCKEISSFEVASDLISQEDRP